MTPPPLRPQRPRHHQDPGPAHLRDAGAGQQRVLPGQRVPPPRAHHRPHRVPLQAGAGQPQV